MKPKIIILLLIIVLVGAFFLAYQYSSPLTGKVTGKITYSIGNKTAGITEIATEGQLEVMKEMKVSIGIENNGEKQAFKLKIFISKEGNIEDSADFSFELGAGKEIVFTTDFIPTDIGQYQILAKLHDSKEQEIIDNKIYKFTAISKIGPFDFSLDVLTKMVNPLEELPVTLRMINMGEQGAEVKIRTSLYCSGQTIKEEFAVLLNPRIETAKTISISSCSETGLKTVSSELIFAGTVLASSSSDVFIMQSNKTMRITAPSSLQINIGESKIIGIFVQNDETELTDLKISIENIPDRWFTIEPASIYSLEKEKEAVFIVNFTIPSTVSKGEYQLKINVGASELIESRKMILEILEPVQEAIPEESGKEGITISKATLFYILAPIVIIIIIVIIVGKRRFSNQHKFYERRADVLRAIKRKR